MAGNKNSLRIYLKTLNIMAKFQQIKYNNNGEAYVTFYGRRLKLENFIMTNSPWGKSGPDSIIINNKELEIHGWYSLGYSGAYGIHISDCGDSAKVVYKSNY